jgi:hypothetical protein
MQSHPDGTMRKPPRLRSSMLLAWEAPLSFDIYVVFLTYALLVGHIDCHPKGDFTRKLRISSGSGLLATNATGLARRCRFSQRRIPMRPKKTGLRRRASV